LTDVGLYVWMCFSIWLMGHCYIFRYSCSSVWGQKLPFQTHAYLLIKDFLCIAEA